MQGAGGVMCDKAYSSKLNERRIRFVPVSEAVGMVLGHDITEIRRDSFKGPAFKKGYVLKSGDVPHLLRIGKENLFVLDIADDELHEDDAALRLAYALMGKGVEIRGEPREGKLNIAAEYDGLLSVNTDRLRDFNMLGEVMCATLHSNTVVRAGLTVAGTRAIPLVIKKEIIDRAVAIAAEDGGTISVLPMLKPRAGVVITGNEICSGRIQDAFAPVIRNKLSALGGEIVGVAYAPDSETVIESSLRELLDLGANILITTGGMSIDPDDVTRFAIRNLGAEEITYGAPVLPGAMLLVAYYRDIPVIGIPACGMYHNITVFDLVLPRVLAGQKVGRKEIAEFGHGGLCMHCQDCRYPVCPFGK
jgi:hypothetical protein